MLTKACFGGILSRVFFCVRNKSCRALFYISVFCLIFKISDSYAFEHNSFVDNYLKANPITFNSKTNCAELFQPGKTLMSIYGTLIAKNRGKVVSSKKPLECSLPSRPALDNRGGDVCDLTESLLSGSLGFEDKLLLPVSPDPQNQMLLKIKFVDESRGIEKFVYSYGKVPRSRANVDIPSDSINMVMVDADSITGRLKHLFKRLRPSFGSVTSTPSCGKDCYVYKGFFRMPEVRASSVLVTTRSDVREVNLRTIGLSGIFTPHIASRLISSREKGKKDRSKLLWQFDLEKNMRYQVGFEFLAFVDVRQDSVIDQSPILDIKMLEDIAESETAEEIPSRYISEEDDIVRVAIGRLLNNLGRYEAVGISSVQLYFSDLKQSVRPIELETYDTIPEERIQFSKTAMSNFLELTVNGEIFGASPFDPSPQTPISESQEFFRFSKIKVCKDSRHAVCGSDSEAIGRAKESFGMYFFSVFEPIDSCEVGYEIGSEELK